MNIKIRMNRFWGSGLIQDFFSEGERTHTRKISPKLGALGVLGFLGFLGFIPAMLDLTSVFTSPPFFFFFAFFGFFGFYYEGKMSGTLIDERFQFNAYRAAAISHRVSLSIIIVCSILSMSMLRLDTYSMLSCLVAIIGLSFGLSVFLEAYLLYSFENGE